jgi:Zn-dependent protease/CBS domain-containing protein
MRGWSFPIGRFFGVEVRIHALFLLLLVLSMSLSSIAKDAGAARGFGLWLTLLFAVAVREVARALAAAWYNLELRSVLLLPTGGLMTSATLEATERAADPAMEKHMAIVGPIANIGAGLLIAAIALAAAPGVQLLALPWIAPTHLLRALIWTNLLLGAVNLLPAFPLDGGRVFRGGPAGKAGDHKAPWKDAGMGTGIAIALVVGGLLLGSVLGLWFIIMGAFVLLAARMENQGLLVQTEVDTVRMRDVMLTQFSTLSASDTLEDALQRAVHTLQDVFPVVRGGNLVGAVSRQNIVEALATDGNSYVQGVMTKRFETALADDSLFKTLRRIMGGEGAQLVPVMEGERIVGIITPQNLQTSMGLLNQSRRLRRTDS